MSCVRYIYIYITLRREKRLGCNFALHFTSYLSIALSKILPHSKTIKNAKELSVFGKNNSRSLSIFFTNSFF